MGPELHRRLALTQQYTRQLRQAQQGKEQTLKKLKKALRAEIFANTVRLEIAERGALSPDELTRAERVGILVRAIRHWRGMSEAELGRQSGLSAETISRLEHGKHTPREKTVVRLAEALGVPRKQLDADVVFARWPSVYQTVISEREVVAEQMREAEEAAKN
jgi:transcriptional regulator with XRE-family HTH domain